MLAISPDLNRLSGILDALSNGTRIRMIEYLLKQGESDVSSMVHEIGLSQSALSQHLRVLYHLSIVQFRKKSQFRYYSVCEEMKAILGGLIEVAYSHSGRKLEPIEDIPTPFQALESRPKGAHRGRLVVNRKKHPRWRR